MAYKARQKNRFDSSSRKPYRLSRTKLENFVRCPRCFYLDRRLGVGQVRGPAFTLNSATDTLLKKEFDACRADRRPHPVFLEHGLDAVPYAHAEIDAWRENSQGVRWRHEPTNLLVTGALDDVWELADGRLAVVDYKSTSTTKQITLEDEWKQAYKRQLEVYQWLLRLNGFRVARTAYLLYVNADTSRAVFDGRLEFDTLLLSYEGDDAWVDPTLRAAHACLMRDDPPESNPECDHCGYREAAAAALACGV